MICLPGSITGDAKFKGLKTDEIVDSTPRIVLGLFKSAILKPNLPNTMLHSTPRGQLTGSSSRLRSDAGTALFSIGI